MAIYTTYVSGNDQTRQARKCFMCDTQAELPVTGLNDGDIAFAADTKTFWTSAGGIWLPASSDAPDDFLLD